MTDRKDGMPRLAGNEPMEHPLPRRPPAPRLRADMCPRCRCVHWQEDEARRCRQAAAQREQT